MSNPGSGDAQGVQVMKLTAPPDIPVDLLFDCSKNTLHEYVLARLNNSANLRKELRALLEALLDALVEARFGQWMMEHREELRSMNSLPVGEELFDFGDGEKRRRVVGDQRDAPDGLRADAAD